MDVPVTLMYASIFALFSFVLSFRAVGYRGKTGISVLHGDPVDMELAERVRVHQNFIEYVPMVLIVMAGIELAGGSLLFLYVAGDLLIVARIAHAVGLRHDNISHPARIIGAGGTALVTLLVAGYGLWLSTKTLMA